MKIRYALIFILAVALSVIFLNLKVDALEKTKVPPEVDNLIDKAFEDNSWLNLDSEEEFRNYCESIYCEEMAEHMVAALMFYVAENDDWHTLVKVGSTSMVKNTGTEMEVLAQVEYWDLKFSTDNTPSYSLKEEEAHLISIRKENEMYKIAGIDKLPALKKISRVIIPYVLGLNHI